MIKEKKVLTEEEIKELKDLKSNFDTTIYALGTIEAEITALKSTKHDLNLKLVEITNKEKDLAKKLEDKYGQGKLLLETGEIEPLE
tara:strand:+ start:968 stop:1225 length:258 start_codon:yes stop_codon:yes gene_type:complete